MAIIWEIADRSGYHIMFPWYFVYLLSVAVPGLSIYLFSVECWVATES